MSTNSITILFQLAWELAKVAAHVAKHNMQPSNTRRPISLRTPAAPAPVLSQPAPARRTPTRCGERTPEQLELGDKITRQLITVGHLMQAYARSTSISAYMQNDERGQRELVLDIFKVENQHRGRTLIGPFSRQ